MKDWLERAAKRSGWSVVDEARNFLDAGGVLDGRSWRGLSGSSKAALVAACMQREAGRAVLAGMAATPEGLAAVSDQLDGGDQRRQMAVDRMAAEVLDGRTRASNGAEEPPQLP